MERSSPHPRQPAGQIQFIEMVDTHPAPLLRAAPILPPQLSRLLGREREIEQLLALLLDPRHRLLTITGPGGVGKTRLAFEVARQCADAFPDGTVFISLAPVREPAHVAPALARALGLTISNPGDLLANLAVTLHEQRILIVLDNFEHVVDAASDLATLLADCPRIVLLVTSRAPLRIGAELLFPTTPLSLETAGAAGDEAQPGAVQLFVERARHSDRTFALTSQNESDVYEICRRLDGLPLAIELAAARIGAVSTADLLARLDPRLPILTGGDRDLPERQQTMRSTIAWSYELLSDANRELFRWLSVFVGGFRLPSAEAVMAARQIHAHTENPDERSVVDGIGALMASNLLHRIPGQPREYRYAMLEVVREFGLEQLALQGELAAARAAHVGWYATNREWLDPNRYQPGEPLIDHLWDIDAEQPNLRAALATCEATGDYHHMLDIAGAAAVFWHHRGFLGEGRAWLERALQQAADPAAEPRCWALAGLGLICWTQSDFTAAEPILLEAFELASELGHMELRALSLHMLALIDIEHRNLASARYRIEIALELWRALELPSDEAMALHILSLLPPGHGEPDTQMDDARRSLAIFESIGHTGGIGHAQHRIGRLTQQRGDERQAFTYFALSISTWLGIDERWAINRSLIVVAGMAATHQRHDIAATLVGVIDARRRLSNSELSSENQQQFERICQAVDSALGRTEARSRRDAGGKLSPAEIDDLVTRLGGYLFSGSVLSQRETEVLRRMASGDTDREIADALFVSPRTVHTHVSHILTKLDVPSRRLAVKRAAQLGLLDNSLSPFELSTLRPA